MTKLEKARYLLYHLLLDPKTPEKLRAMFDCTAKFWENSLNDRLLQGLD